MKLQTTERRRYVLPPAALVLVTALVLTGSTAWAQPDYSKVQIETVEVTPGIYMLVGSGGNIGVSVGKSGTFLIDDQYAPLSEKIQAAIAELTPSPVRFVVNTHWHGDHTGGNEPLGKSGAIIVAHNQCERAPKKTTTGIGLIYR